MTRKLWACALLTLSMMAATASPVRRGQWRTLKLADGTEVRAEARGDEHVVYWQAADGTRYVADDDGDLFRVATADQLRQRAQARRMPMARSMQRRAPSKRMAAATDRYKGKQRGLIILVQFRDRSFSKSDPKALYNHVANTPAYSENGFKGSVRDYFLAQSAGAFDLSFDVVGPVTMPNTYAYYGRNNDAKVGEMVHDACLAVADSVDFTAYDWDRDGEAEEVFVLYAGYGQADHSANDNYIWPHMYALTGYAAYADSTLTIDGTRVDVYACANELDADNAINGIGTFCHEFSHCLGLPDMYDTAENGTNFGMGAWSLMDYGCYSDNGMTPSGYTGYELMACGWAEPTELKADTTIAAMRSLGSHGGSFIVRNPANDNEYYILDNRQLDGFDAHLPGHGLLVTHVDYNQTAWDYNIVNATGYFADAKLNNTHQRATIFHADNDDDFYTQDGDAYPCGGNDSLTQGSTPAAKVYNRAAGGAAFMPCAITQIRENGDGTVAFNFRRDTTATAATPAEPQGDVLLYESFGQCTGAGGNDGRFSGNVGSSAFRPDLDGWEGTATYGARQCARFGKSTAGTGAVMSPAFTLTGDTVTLTFRAAAWNHPGDGTTLLLTLDGTDAAFVANGSKDTTLTMERGAWTDYTLQLVGSGTVRLMFGPDRRFFLDEVRVARPVAAGIATLRAADRPEAPTAAPIYALDGRCVGRDWQRLPKGVYVVGGRKVVKTR